MRASTIFPAVVLVARIRAQTDEFEAPNFNITRALAANGINASTLPELHLGGCAVAVSVYLLQEVTITHD
jgi:hypothetical protein